jgi:hypothetical protein
MKLLRFLFGCLWGRHYNVIGICDNYICLDCERIIHIKKL